MTIQMRSSLLRNVVIMAVVAAMALVLPKGPMAFTFVVVTAIVLKFVPQPIFCLAVTVGSVIVAGGIVLLGGEITAAMALIVVAVVAIGVQLVRTFFPRGGLRLAPG